MATESVWETLRLHTTSGGEEMKKVKMGLWLVVLISFLTLNPNRMAFAQGEDGSSPDMHITQVDTSQFPLVTVYLSVTDSNGEPLGIDPARLRLEEDGTLIEADQIEGLGQVELFKTLLIVDVSGSMNKVGKLDTAKSAAKVFVQQMRHGDEVGLLAFNTEIDYVQPLTSDQDMILASIDGLVAGSDTAMYDALIEGVVILETLPGRKAIIVLTDGMDNRSQVGLTDVVSGIGPAGLSISTVGLGDPSQLDATTSGIDVPALQTLAAQAGGEFAYANDSEQLMDLYKRYARTLQSEYMITYTSPGDLRDGLTRNLSVSLSDVDIVSGAADYNPGGLVPEVSGPASWSVFFAALGILILLLFIPSTIRFAMNMLGKAEEIRTKPTKPRIRFTDT